MNKVILFTLLALFITVYSIVDTRVSFAGHKVYRLHVVTQEQMDKIQQLENDAKIDIWGRNALKQYVDIRVPPQYMHDFRKIVLNDLRIPYKTLVEDVGELIHQEFIANQIETDDFHKKYHTYAEITTWLKEQEAKHPDIVKLDSIGKTYENRDIWVMEIKKPSQQVKKGMMFTGGMHAREWIGVASMLYVIDQLLNNPKYASLLDKFNYYIIPVQNVDGYIHTHEKDRMWRKTRSPNQGSSCIGTDPNRNWDIDWCRQGCSSNPCSEAYRGKAPFSEIEMQHVSNYTKNLKDLYIYADWHSYSQLFMRPYGYKTAAPKDEPEMKRLGDAAANAMTKKYGVKFQSGRIAQIIYACSGTSADWVYDKLGKYAYAVELRDTGRYGFILPPDQIIPQGEEVCAAIETMSE